MTDVAENTPKLRFPGFSGSWDTTPSHKEFEYRNGLNFTRGSVGETIKVVGVADFQKYTGLSDTTKLSEITIQGEVSENDLLAEGDLLFVRSNGNKALIGRCLLIGEFDDKVSFSGFTIRGRRKGTNVSTRFAGLLFRSERFRSYLNVAGGGTNISNLSQAILEDFPLTFPGEQEQDRISDFIEAVDEKIGQLTRKKALLEDYKKGCMQQLFSRKCRFKDDEGNDFPDWEERGAGSLFETISNKNHNSDLPLLSITQDGGAALRDSLDKDIQVSVEGLKSYKIVEPGDFIISLRSFQGGIEYSDVLGICSPAYTVLKPTEAIADGFFKQLFKRAEFISRLSATTVGIREGKQISYSAFSTLQLPFPSLPEQQKIADFLSAIDTKIRLSADELSSAQDFKRGLLQQMFV